MSAVATDTEEFSIADGGALDRIQLRLGLLEREASPISKRTVLFALLVWLPLLILSAAQGVLFANAKIPFLSNSTLYSRVLVASACSFFWAAFHVLAHHRDSQT
jgi:hypothetical protein